MDDRTEALDKLLNDLEPTDPALRARYREAIDAGLVDLKSGCGKALYVVIGLLGLISCVVCGSLGLTEPETTPRAVRGLLILFAFFGLGWTLLAGWAIARGRGNFAVERQVAARMAFGFTLAAVLALALVSTLLDKQTVSMPLIMSGLALLTLAAVIAIGARIEQAEQAIRDQVLRLECRTAGLAELISRSRGDLG
jgi:peptidoglycan/LPS O-acetylase OafA/YrhL